MTKENTKTNIKSNIEIKLIGTQRFNRDEKFVRNKVVGSFEAIPQIISLFWTSIHTQINTFFCNTM